MNQPLNGSDICATRMRRAGNAIVAARQAATVIPSFTVKGKLL
jgi:hypothetical protein